MSDKEPTAPLGVLIFPEDVPNTQSAPFNLPTRKNQNTFKMRVGSTRRSGGGRANTDLYARFSRDKQKTTVGTNQIHGPHSDEGTGSPHSSTNPLDILALASSPAQFSLSSSSSTHDSPMLQFSASPQSTFSDDATHAPLPVEHQTVLLDVKQKLIAYTQQGVRTPEILELSRTLKKMDAAFQQYPKRVIAAAFRESKQQPAPARRGVGALGPGPAVQPSSHGTSHHHDVGRVQIVEGGGESSSTPREWAPRADHRLYFSHCCNWLESITRFSKSKAMKEHLVKTLDILCACPSDGLIMRDSAFRTLWANDIFCKNTELNPAELTSPSFTPLDYVHPDSLMSQLVPFAEAMHSKKVVRYELPLIKYVSKHSKQIIPASFRVWFVRDHAEELLFVVSAASF